MLIGFATGPNTVASDGGNGSLYTNARLKELGRPGVSVTDMLTHVNAELRKTSGGEQIPIMESGLSEVFALVPGKEGGGTGEAGNAKGAGGGAGGEGGGEGDEGEPYMNGLGMKFVPAGTKGVLFGIWETRVKDFRAFLSATGYDAITNTANGVAAYTVEKEGKGVNWKQAGESWVDARFLVGHGQDETHPVACVSHLDAEAFCERLKKKKREGGRLPEGWRRWWGRWKDLRMSLRRMMGGRGQPLWGALWQIGMGCMIYGGMWGSGASVGM